MIKIQECLEHEKEFYTAILEFIDNFKDIDQKFLKITSIIDKQYYVQKNQYEKRENLLVLIKLVKHHRSQYSMFEKIERILIYFKPKIKQTFSNGEIFKILKDNKKLLLLLFKNEIIIPDQSIINMILFYKYQFYFFPEISPFLNERKKESIMNKMKKINENIFDHFEEKRQEGENESYICHLIRKDSLENFISFLNQTNLTISSTIKPSIFETNSFLNKNKETTLIEYAAFCGSIQIFQYLIRNKVELKPSLILFAIHGRNPEIIQIIENYDLKKDHVSYNLCLKEAIKCHHNELVNHIIEKYRIQKDSNYLSAYCYQYHNFQFVSCKFEIKHVPYFFEFDYIPIIEIALKSWDIKSTNTVIQTLCYLLMRFKKTIFFNI